LEYRRIPVYDIKIAVLEWNKEFENDRKAFEAKIESKIELLKGGLKD
jgi:hypothetical protein